jgi:hypothetical protein
MAHAEPFNLNVKNFNFTYTDPHGEGSAASFTRSHNVIDDAVNVSVDKVESNFKLSVSGAESQEYELKNAPSFISEAQTMSISGFNLNLAEALNLSLGAGRFNSPDDSLKLDGVALDCSRDLTQAEVADQLISGCIQKLSFKSSKFSSESIDGPLVFAVSESVRAAVAATDMAINSVDLKVVGGKYTLSADVKASVSGKVKSSGVISYDAAGSKVTLKISEVKFSIFNIRGKVFEALKKKESEKMKVQEPYIYYSLK